jgi:uncharacterized protein
VKPVASNRRCRDRRLVLLAAAAWPCWLRAGELEDFFGAVGRDDERSVRRLLEKGVDPNSVDSRGQPALVLAMRDDCPRVAELLLAQPAIRPDLANAHNETALMMAALHGRRDWVEKLLARGGRLDREGWTPLHYAASGPAPDIVELLVDRGAPIDAGSPNRSTPLMMAAGYGAIDAADLLLRLGANPTLRNDASLAAADFARRAGRDSLVTRIENAVARRPTPP